MCLLKLKFNFRSFHYKAQAAVVLSLFFPINNINIPFLN